MADVQGLLADPRFQGLDPATQKETLGKLDPRFSKLTDEQFTEFKTKAVPKESPGLMQRAKDYFRGPNGPTLDTFMHGRPIKGADGVERMPQGGYSPAEEFVLGGVLPGKAATKVPAIAEEVTGRAMGSGRIGKFFKGISEAAKNEPKPEVLKEPGPISGKATATRFEPGQYDPKVAKPAVEVGGSHVPDYVGPTASEPVPSPEAQPDFPNRGKLGEKMKTHRSSGPNPGSDHGPAPAPKSPPSKAQAVKAAPKEPTAAPPKGRAPRASDEFYETQGRADKVFRVADDMFRKKITAQALEAKGKPADMSETTWKHILFRLRGLETGRVKPITPE